MEDLSKSPYWRYWDSNDDNLKQETKHTKSLEEKYRIRRDVEEHQIDEYIHKRRQYLHGLSATSSTEAVEKIKGRTVPYKTQIVAPITGYYYLTSVYLLQNLLGPKRDYDIPIGVTNENGVSNCFIVCPVNCKNVTFEKRRNDKNGIDYVIEFGVFGRDVPKGLKITLTLHDNDKTKHNTPIMFKGEKHKNFTEFYRAGDVVAVMDLDLIVKLDSHFELKLFAVDADEKLQVGDEEKGRGPFLLQFLNPKDLEVFKSGKLDYTNNYVHQLLRIGQVLGYYKGIGVPSIGFPNFSNV